MVFTVELKDSTHKLAEAEVEICCDKEGIDFFVQKLTKLREHAAPRHEHFKTPSWAGSELTEEKQGSENVLIHHLRVVLLSPRTPSAP